MTHKPTYKPISKIKRVLDNYEEFIQESADHSHQSQLSHFYAKSQSRGQELPEIEWGFVNANLIIQKFEKPNASDELFKGLSSTLLHEWNNHKDLFTLEEVDCYIGPDDYYHTVYQGELVRPTIPLTPKQVGVLASLFTEGANEKDGAHFINFPVKNGEVDWDGFARLAEFIVSTYPLAYKELKKLREPETIDIAIRDEIVASFSPELRELRESTFEYYRNLYEIQMVLNMIQRNHSSFKDGDASYNFKPLRLLLRNDDKPLSNVIEETARIYELTYPETEESNSVKFLMEHVREIMDEALGELLADLEVEGLGSLDLMQPDASKEYVESKLPKVFSALNVMIGLIPEIVEMRQYSYYGTLKKLEF